MADQGASERRSTESSITTAGQTSSLWTTTSPATPQGLSYFVTNLLPEIGNDSASAQSRLRETLITNLGVAAEVSSNRGTSYSNTPIGTKDAHDLNAFDLRAKEALFSRLGTQTTETSARGTSYVNLPIGQESAIFTNFLYKLRAQDSGNANAYVYWVSLVPTVQSANVPFIGPLINLVVMAVWQQGH